MKHNEPNWDYHLKRLINYANRQCWVVKFKSRYESITTPSNRTIVINSEYTKQKKCYILLHELGHTKLLDSITYNSDFQSMIIEIDNRRYNSLAYRIGRVQEEYLAWINGESIAKHLNIPINNNYYIRVKAEGMKTYFRWALNWKKPVTIKKLGKTNGSNDEQSTNQSAI